MGIVARLPEDVVKKIAAGEVIVRPANAVKELVENSLDAQATEITVTMKEGGLAILQVKDNGSGIYKEDLPLVCERFATSKLRQVDDLTRMNTFGFRGEALASIAVVATLNVTSKRRDESCAYQVNYKDGAMVGRIRPSAGEEGTAITVEGLFSGSEARRRALKNVNEEAARILDVVARFAVHRPDVAFTVKRMERGCELRSKGDGKRSNVVASLYGEEVAKDMIEFSLSEPTLYFEVEGVLSRPYSTHSAQSKDVRRKRQKQFVLFINGRPVSCPALKGGIESTLASRALATTYLLIALKIDPSRVDVNVHPTKDTVFFLQQDDVIERIQKYVDELLVVHLCTQSTPSFTAAQSKQSSSLSASHPSSSNTPSTSSALIIPHSSSRPMKDDNKRRDHQLVRVSGKERRLEEFFLSSHSTAHSQLHTVPVPQSRDSFVVRNGYREFSLSSLSSLRQSIVSRLSRPLRSTFKSHFFVGCASPTIVLIQHETKLYSIRLDTVMEELFYQMVIFSFGNLGSFRFSSPLPVVQLLRSSCEEDDDRLEEAAEFLLSRTEMLYDYYSLSFESFDGTVCLTTIPSLIHGHSPQLASIPEFLVCLLIQVDWEDEEKCIEGVSRSIAAFFSLHSQWTKGDLYEGRGHVKWRDVVADLVMPKVKERLMPLHAWMDDGTVAVNTQLHDLYKVFERC